MSLLGLLEDIPPAIARPVLALVAGIVRLALAGDDPKKREDALMKTAEDLKREADRTKFGG